MRISRQFFPGYSYIVKSFNFKMAFLWAFRFVDLEFHRQPSDYLGLLDILVLSL